MKYLIYTKLNISSKEILEFHLEIILEQKLLPGPVGGPCLSKDLFIIK